jgi:hypothetical protein
MSADAAARQREAQRQQLLLRALWSRATTLPVSLWLAQSGARAERGLRAYRDHAVGQAARALTAAYPTVAEAVGDEAFTAIARGLWLHEPPRSGDLADWGLGLPAFLASRPELADEPYLPDCARLDWAVHRAGRAADAPDGPPDLAPLLHDDPQALHCTLAPGAAIVVSVHPVVSIFRAHQLTGEARDAAFAQVRARRAHGQGEVALVTRQGLRIAVRELSPPQATFTAALLAGHTLGQALHDAGDQLDFTAWLREAVHDGLRVARASGGPPA